MMASLDENCSLYLTILQSRQKRAPSNATQRDHTTPGLVVQRGVSSGTDLVSEKMSSSSWDRLLFRKACSVTLGK